MNNTNFNTTVSLISCFNNYQKRGKAIKLNSLLFFEIENIIDDFINDKCLIVSSQT